MWIMNEHLSPSQRRKLEIQLARQAAARQHAKNKKTIWQKILAFFRRKWYIRSMNLILAIVGGLILAVIAVFVLSFALAAKDEEPFDE